MYTRTKRDNGRKIVRFNSNCGSGGADRYPMIMKSMVEAAAIHKPSEKPPRNDATRMAKKKKKKNGLLVPPLTATKPTYQTMSIQCSFPKGINRGARYESAQ